MQTSFRMEKFKQSINQPSKKHYKFNELKVYSSTEWLSGNRKQYRQVFDAHETGYIYAELSFYNKLFDEESWPVKIDLVCHDLNTKDKTICNLSFQRKISKSDHTIYIREGWGNKKTGQFWKPGTYYWEAYIDGDLIATKYFYVIDSLDVEDQHLIKVNSIKLYEGQYDDINEDDRYYLKSFDFEETKYIYIELKLDNLFKEIDWHFEVFARFFNSSHQLKGEVIRLRKIKQNDETITISAGWGSNVKGSWKVGSYSIEVLFLGKIVGTVFFDVTDEHIEGIPTIVYSNNHPCVLQLTETIELDEKSFDEIMLNLTQLIGLDHIKKQVQDHAQYIQFLQLRKDKGFKEEESINVHFVFTGNPGTGKTTVAHLIGALYKKMGLLSKGHIHEVDRADLVGEYIGQTAPKVKENIEKARGGVLFIDEAYALARSNDDSKDFGREVIEILVKEMSNGEGDMAVIVAGYPKEMKHFIDSNPGLKSRFKHYFEFSDYTPQELSQISELVCKRKEVQLSSNARELIDEMIVEAFRTRDRNFGNARYVHDLIENAKVNMGLRLMALNNTEELEKDELMLVNSDDVNKIELTKNPIIPNIPIDQKLLDNALSELNSMIGIKSVKQQIFELVDIIKYHKKYGKQVLNNYFLHTTFIGNPGTGKTTVARILTKIYKALGILERGHMVETDRQGLVAGFVGQTAIKTAERIDEAMGGVLFIDEAYALSNFNGLQGDYGNEAIQTILKRMEDNRGHFFVFAAGYPDNMDVFLKANPGLNSRFDKQLIFNDYSPSELMLIAKKMIQDNSYRCTDEAYELLGSFILSIHRTKSKFFGNARTMRSLVLDLIKSQNLRLSKIDSIEDATLINIEDVKILIEEKNNEETLTKSGIGFKSR